MELVQLKEVSKSYKKVSILEDVNISIEEGDLFGIIGSSGSGKTTLLNLITGFLTPNKGTINCFFSATGNPINISKHLNKAKSSIGFAPQHNSFYHHLTVEENLIHFGKIYGLKKKTLKNNVDSLLRSTKLEEHRKKLAKNLSGGMQKRLDISCSLVHKPKMIVLDEPTADLDPILQKEIMQFLRQINSLGVTIIVASHHLHLIEKYCNKVAIIHKGKVHSHGLMEHIRKPYQRNRFSVKISPGDDRSTWINSLQNRMVGELEERDHHLVIYPSNDAKGARDVVHHALDIIDHENMSVYDVSLRKPTLHEIFEKIVSE